MYNTTGLWPGKPPYLHDIISQVPPETINLIPCNHWASHLKLCIIIISFEEMACLIDSQEASSYHCLAVRIFEKGSHNNEIPSDLKGKIISIFVPFEVN